VVTAIIQSSSASVGILQAVTQSGAVPVSSMVPIILGQNIGTCVTALLSSVGANRNARRAAFIHLYFNVIGTIVFIAGIYSLRQFVALPFWEATANSFTVAKFHIFFNITNTVILLPFNRFLIKLANVTVKDRPGTKRGHPLGRAFSRQSYGGFEPV
jgi:phosphate:Na+ symporter